MLYFLPGSHLLELSVDQIIEDLGHRLDHVRVLCLGEEPGAHTQHVHARLNQCCHELYELFIFFWYSVIFQKKNIFKTFLRPEYIWYLVEFYCS